MLLIEIFIAALTWAVSGLAGYSIVLVSLDAKDGPKVYGDLRFCCGFCDAGVRRVLRPLIFLGPASFILGVLVAIIACMMGPFCEGSRCLLGRRLRECPDWHRVG